jgi:uncharacterized cofD-like protein
MRIRLLTSSGDIPTACPEALAAVRAADMVVRGPGSWFTSVLPHLLVPDLHRALVETSAARVVVLNLVPQPGETAGFSPEQHLDVLCQHAPELRIDAVIADVDAVPTPDRLRRAAAGLGAQALLASVSTPGAADRHDPSALARSLLHALTETRSARGREMVGYAGRKPGGGEEDTWR